MHGSNYAYFLLIALVVTSFTANGTLALWAATSPRQLLLRMLGVLLVPAPLLFRSAIELYGVFALQSVLVMACVVIACFRIKRYDGADPSNKSGGPYQQLQFRFSLFTLLLTMLVVAVGLTAVIQLPKWENLAWRTVIISSFGAATGTLAAASICRSQRKLLAFLVAASTCLIVGIGISQLDWFFEATLQIAGWPPRPITPEVFMGSPTNYDDYDAWYFIPILIATATVLLIYSHRAQHAMLSRSASMPTTPRAKRTSIVARIAFITLSVIFAALPIATMIALLLPAPIPTIAMPIPNGHDDFTEAARVAVAMKFSVSDIDHANVDQLAPFAAGADQVDALVAAGLEKPCYVPTNFYSSLPNLGNEAIDGYYVVEMALSAKGRLVVLANRFDEAAAIYLRATQFGFHAARGALVWSGSLIRNRSSFGTRPLYAIHERLSDETLAKCIDRLAAIEASDETMEDVLYRHRVWTERRNGWHGHLKFLLEQVSVDEGNGLSSDYWHRKTFKDGYRRIHAINRLMICEFALLRYHREHNEWPASLSALVPNFIPAVPLDPFDPAAGPLRYRRQGDDYLLYSVHEDGIDHSGQPTHPAEWDVTKFHDLRLDHAFSD